MFVRSRVLTFTLISLLALVPAAIGRGNCLHRMASTSALLWVGVPAAGVLGYGLLRGKHILRGPALLVLWGLGLQLGAGHAFFHLDVSSAKKHCEALDRVARLRG